MKFKEVRYKGMGQGPDTWKVRPAGDANLLRELSKVIRCRVKPIVGIVDDWMQYGVENQFNAVVTFDDLNRMRRFPFLFMTSENPFELTVVQKKNLKDYITSGGFVLMDDCVVLTGGDFFYRCAYDLLEELFGAGSVRVIPKEHEVFHNVYDLSETGLPWLHYIGSRYPRGTGGAPHGQPYGARGLFIGDRLAVFLSSQDIHCGWCDSHGLEWGLDLYRKTIEMGINIVLYAMTH